MSSRLPPPDPHESLGLSPLDPGSLNAPTAVFVRGEPAPAEDAVADAILDVRPGLLLVYSA